MFMPRTWRSDISYSQLSYAVICVSFLICKSCYSLFPEQTAQQKACILCTALNVMAVVDICFTGRTLIPQFIMTNISVIRSPFLFDSPSFYRTGLSHDCSTVTASNHGITRCCKVQFASDCDNCIAYPAGRLVKHCDLTTDMDSMLPHSILWS